ncbi:hypothetical protein LTR56_003958 [Elasticomyces elasticus]|nr:hypothetical protein LTR56_003958 [Elasticomyces elasticus]KAK3661054.1 hypothetical protein LTR22_007680 [Elasticomyces elasticus]KAK4921061.1 hypothetical protein LTR49_011431 [Elasticomyces elasticus]KAK5752976.1 hypothetical protein LTS12_016947 [Elasticomyces elasticus]
MATMLHCQLERQEHQTPPSHHVIAAKTLAGWTSMLPSWGGALQGANESSDSHESALEGSSGNKKKPGRIGRKATNKEADTTQKISGFRNPWPSWHKPSAMEVWQALEWGDDTDPCIEIARKRAIRSPKPATAQESADLKSNKSQAAALLRVTKPDFSYDAQHGQVKTTWLGHAGVLVQLAPLKQGDRPVRCLFDPMFSQRCSPTQTAGPIRSYPPPCKVEDLPPIDILLISHNHYDHLDYDTILALEKRNPSNIQIFVPLGNRQWFLDSGISPDRVFELDWWDKARITTSSTGGNSLTVTCTPSQHNSGRTRTDGNATLWSSWYIEHSRSADEVYRIFFAGDTGYQFHTSPGWPPAPPTSDMERKRVAAGTDDDSPTAKHPVCPAFEEVTALLGPPHLLLLPIAVGATFDYLRSMAPVPDSLNPIPRHSAGVTAANHMPPWDSVRLLNVMTSPAEGKTAGQTITENKTTVQWPVAVAMHWGTFVTDPVEVLKTLGQLEWACEAHNVHFARSMEEVDDDGRAIFLALNHGESVLT